MMRKRGRPSNPRVCRCSCFSTKTRLRAATHVTMSGPRGPRGTHDAEQAATRDNLGAAMPQMVSRDTDIVDVEMEIVEEKVKEEETDIDLARNVHPPTDEVPSGEGSSGPVDGVPGATGDEEDRTAGFDDPQGGLSVVTTTHVRNNCVSFALNASSVGFLEFVNVLPVN